MFLLLLYSLLCLPLSESFGFDSANTCGPNGKISRRGRAQILAAIPCDLTQQPYCEKAGQAYPWHAVRRFVHENQGLMKRMYGDVLHISVLRDEIQNNEIEDDDIEVTAARYSAEHQRRSSKFMHEPEEYTKQSNGVLEEPHFRPMSETTTEESVQGNNERKSTRRNRPGYRPTEGTRYRPYYNTRRRNRTTTTTTTTESPITDPVVLEDIKLLITDGTEDKILKKNNNNDDSNLQSNSVYEIPATTLLEGDNIKVIESPKLNDKEILQNLTQQLSTISSTLKVATSTLKPHHFYTRRRPIYKITKESVLNSKVQSKESERPSSFALLNAKITTILSSSTVMPLTITTTTTTTPPTTTTTTTMNLVKGDNNTTTITNDTIPLTTTTTTPITTNTTATNKTTTISTSSAAMLPLRVNGELVSNHKATSSITATTTTTTNHQESPTSITTMSTKPVLRDGQLFQDTIKQESSSPTSTPPPLPSQASTLTNLRGINACPVKEEVVAPFWANNTRGEILALLNMYPFEQYVHWEKCTHEHKQMYCRDGCRCEQQYRLHRLLAYDPHNECRGIFSDWFRFPSCCICKCYNIPMDFRATSRSPRSEQLSMIDDYDRLHTIERAERQVKSAIYEHATEDWYRPAADDDYAYIDYADDNGDI